MTAELVAARAHLQLVTDAALPRERLLDVIAAAARAGVDSVQIRDHAAGGAELLALARAAIARVRGTTALVLVNDRIDVAAAAGADGVHLPQRGVGASAARAILGPRALIGVSVHSAAEALAAEADGADYVTFGHVYGTPSHAGEPPRGLGQLREAVDAVRVPVIAIGGIRPQSVAGILAAGASGAAVIGAICASEDPEAAARDLRIALDRSAALMRNERWSGGTRWRSR